MRRVSSVSPPRVRHESGALLRLALCLAMLHACGHAASQATSEGYATNAVVERGETHVERSGNASRAGAAFVVEHGDRKLEGDGSAPEQPVIAARKATEPVGAGAGEVAGDSGEVAVPVGECSGARFKKCR